MFERFNERGRQVVVLAQEEARSSRLRHNYIGTEHLLLGVLRERRGLGAQVLESLGVSVERARDRVVGIVGTGLEVCAGQIPFTPRAKNVLELALREMLSVSDPDVDTEHILLALTSVPEGVAMRLLADFDATPEKVRRAVDAQRSVRRLHATTQSGDPPTLIGIDPAWLGGLSDLLARIGSEIRGELGRAPDLSDLLLCLTCVADIPAVRALSQLGVDHDQLQRLIEDVRACTQTEMTARAAELRETAHAKELAIEEQRLQDAARLRDHERVLRDRLRAGHVAPSLAELRQRLGLPNPDS